MALEIWEHEHSILFLNKVTKDMEIKASGLYTDIWDEDDKMVPPTYTLVMSKIAMAQTAHEHSWFMLIYRT